MSVWRAFSSVAKDKNSNIAPLFKSIIADLRAYHGIDPAQIFLTTKLSSVENDLSLAQKTNKRIAEHTARVQTERKEQERKFTIAKQTLTKKRTEQKSKQDNATTLKEETIILQKKVNSNYITIKEITTENKRLENENMNILNGVNDLKRRHAALKESLVTKTSLKAKLKVAAANNNVTYKTLNASYQVTLNAAQAKFVKMSDEMARKKDREALKSLFNTYKDIDPNIIFAAFNTEKKVEISGLRNEIYNLLKNEFSKQKKSSSFFTPLVQQCCAAIAHSDLFGAYSIKHSGMSDFLKPMIDNTHPDYLPKILCETDPAFSLLYPYTTLLALEKINNENNFTNAFDKHIYSITTFGEKIKFSDNEKISDVKVLKHDKRKQDKFETSLVFVEKLSDILHSKLSCNPTNLINKLSTVQKSLSILKATCEHRSPYDGSLEKMRDHNLKCGDIKPSKDFIQREINVVRLSQYKFDSPAL